MVGKRTGDEVEVNAPKGKITYVVIQIRYV
jgi:transcription elongation GreA/GreB family factor